MSLHHVDIGPVARSIHEAAKARRERFFRAANPEKVRPPVADAPTEAVLVAALVPAPPKPHTLRCQGRIRLIQAHIARDFNLDVADLTGSRRHGHLIEPRHLAMYLCRRVALKSHPEIGRRFGGRDHTVSIHACQKFERRIATSSAERARIDQYAAEIEVMLAEVEA